LFYSYQGTDEYSLIYKFFCPSCGAVDYKSLWWGFMEGEGLDLILTPMEKIKSKLRRVFRKNNV
jgi:hypothetical protein